MNSNVAAAATGEKSAGKMRGGEGGPVVYAALGLRYSNRSCFGVVVKTPG